MDFYQFNDSISDNIGPDVQVDTLRDIGPSWLHVNSKILHAFIASTSVIVVSELGDKTFFIAAILAMKNSRIVVFVAAMLALGLMTALASVVGAATTIIPRIYIHYSAIVLSVLFGLKMLKEGRLRLIYSSTTHTFHLIAHLYSSFLHNNNNNNKVTTCRPMEPRKSTTLCNPV